MKKKGGGCGCLGAPIRALSRACDSACSLYVRGMYVCARGLPPGSSAAGIAGHGFAGSSAASSLRHRVSSDKADDDLVRAAAAAYSRCQRRVAAEPPEAVGYVAGNKGSATGGLVGAARVPARKRAMVAPMDTIAEDAPCEFGPHRGASAVSSVKPPRRGAFGAVKARSDNLFARLLIMYRYSART